MSFSFVTEQEREVWVDKMFKKLILIIITVGFAHLPKLISSQNSSELSQEEKRAVTEETTTLTEELEERECEGVPCIPKCCKKDELLMFNISQDAYDCLLPNKDSANLTARRPFVYTRPHEKFDPNRPVYFQTEPKDYCGIYYHSRRKITKRSASLFPECFQIMENGSLNYLWTDKTWKNVPFSNYCVDGLEIHETQQLYKLFLGNEEDYGVIICDDEHEDEEHAVFTTYAAGYLIAGFFMLLTCIAYVLTWKVHKLQGWNTLSHSATMLLMYVFLAVDYFLPDNIHDSKTCRTIGIFVHFFFLSNFCWLTTICFGLFLTFRVLKRPNPYSNLKKKFLVNASFGWGLPLLFVVVSVILNEYYRLDPCTQAFIPYYGESRCSIGERALGIYLYYPTAFLLALNFVFFGATSYKLYKMNKESKRARENLKTEELQLFWLLVKLFCVMGFTWSFEIMGWLINVKATRWFWYAFDMVNCFQAVIIFIIHVGKPNILASLKSQFFHYTSMVSKYTTTTTTGSANDASQNDSSHRAKK